MTPALLGSYSAYFAQRATEAANERRHLGLVIPALVFALILLVVWLDSDPVVWVILAGLTVAVHFGVRGLRSAATAVQSACDDLGALSEQIGVGGGREQLLNWLAERITPTDDSHVAEAARSCAFHQGSDAANAAARMCFARPHAQLASGVFIRTALVLGGLFGTVLCFALQLSPATMAYAADLGQLTGGLRGALASTLTGILGSLLLGYFISRLDRVVDESVAEATALLGGPFRSAVSRREGERVGSETDLWEGVRTAVEELTERTGATYDQLAGEVQGFTGQFATIVERIESLPALKFPPSLRKLDATVEEFGLRAEALGASTEAMVAAVGTMGLVAPARTLAALSEMADAAKESHSSTRAVVYEITARLDGMSGAIARLEEAKEDPIEVAGRLDELRVQSEGVRDVLQRSLDGFRSSTETILARLEATLVAQSTKDQASSSGENALAPVRQVGDQVLATLARQMAQLEAAISRLDSAQLHEQVSPQEAEQTAGRHAALTAAIADLGSQVRDTRSSVAALSEQARRLDKLDAIAAFCSRAERAPFLRLLMIPFTRKRLPPSATG